MGEDERGEEGAGQTTEAHAGAVKSVRQGGPEMHKLMTKSIGK